MQIIFGPVNSRRFGLSLGIDLSPYEKICNFDCVYCELEPKKAINKQSKIISVDEIIKALENKLKENIKFDIITLTANGEPSMYPHIKELVNKLRKINKKLLILSNASAVLNENSFEALLDIDIVKFSLDSGYEKTFKKINRIHESIKLYEMIDKIIEFKKYFKGTLIMEVLVVKDYNDDIKEFKKLNEIFNIIKPHRIDISTIDRPPAYKVKEVDIEKLKYLSSFIEAPCFVVHRNNTINKLDLNKDELIKLLRLRAQNEIDIKDFSENSKKILNELLKNEIIKCVDLAGMKFYKIV